MDEKVVLAEMSLQKLPSTFGGPVSINGISTLGCV